MSERILKKITTSAQSRNQAGKPLFRLQQYLTELKVSVILCRELLVEVKEVIVLLGLIAFFLWGLIELFLRLYR